MRQTNNAAVFGFWAAFAFGLAGVKAEAGPLASYRVVDLGLPSSQTDINYPLFDSNGNLTYQPTDTRGSYTLGVTYAGSGGPGIPVTNYLHRAGSDTNLLPTSLQDAAHSSLQLYNLNSAGLVIGDAIVNFRDNPFVFSAGTGQISNLYSLPGDYAGSLLHSINDLGQIVGEGGSGAVFYSSPTADPVALSTLLPAATGWKFINASQITDQGVILGYGINPAGQPADFELLPAAVPEPSTLSLFSLGGLGIGVVRLMRRANWPSRRSSAQ